MAEKFKTGNLNVVGGKIISDDARAEIERRKQRIQYLEDPKSDGNISAEYHYSSNYMDQADAEVQRLEREIHALEQGADIADLSKHEEPDDASLPGLPSKIKKTREELQRERQENKINKEKIEACKDWDELFSVLREIGVIKGPKTNFSAERLIEIIEKVRAKKLPINRVIESLGLRATAVRLLEEEGVHQNKDDEKLELVVKPDEEANLDEELTDAPEPDSDEELELKPTPAPDPEEEPEPEPAPTPDPDIDEHRASRITEKRRRLGVVDTDLLEKRARDIAAERMTADKANLKGFSGFFKKIWKHNWNAEYYRSKETRKIKEELMGAGSTFSEGDTSGVRDRQIKEAVLKRFLEDGTELIHFDADEWKDTNVSAEKRAMAESQLQDAIRTYASATDPARAELDFKAERDRIYCSIFAESDGSFNALNVADNVFEFAKEIRGQIEHGKALSDLDLDFQLILGEAKTGVRTEAHYNWIEKKTQQLSKTWVGRFFNETTITAGISTALMLSRIGTGRGARAVMGLAGGVVLAGGIAGLRESQAMERDRAEHARAMASGRTFDPSRAPRRQELAGSVYEMLNAKTMTDDLHNMLYETVGGVERQKTLDRNDIDNIMSYISQIDSRISLSDKEDVDLLSYTDEAMIEVERTNLDLERYRAKIALRNAFALDPSLGNFDAIMQSLNDAREDQLTNGVGGIEERDSAFKKIKRRHITRAVATGAITGITFGLVGQEIGTIWSEQQGVVGGVFGKGGGSKVTSLEWAREKILGVFGWGQPDQGPATILHGKEILSTSVIGGITHDVHNTVNSSITLPQGYELHPSGSNAGAYDVVLNGKSIVKGIEIDPNTGNLNPQSLAELDKAGFHIDSAVKNVTSSLASGTAGTHSVNVQDFAHEHSDRFSQIKRLGWADNGTVRPDKNELRLWDPVEKNGQYEYAVKMNKTGSVFNGQRIDPVKLASEGKLKALFSLSRASQGHPIEVPIKYENGKMFFDVDPKDPILGQLFHKGPGGSIVCDARYVEVGAEMGKTSDGIKQFVMCATEEGKGTDTITTVGNPKIDDFIEKNVTTDITMPNNPDVYLPPVIPIVPRTPLESTRSNEKVVSPYYGANDPEQLLREMQKDGFEPDPYFVKDIDGKKVWVDKDGKELERSSVREKERIEKYLQKQKTPFMEELKTFERQIGPMNEKCRVAINIPDRFEEKSLANLLDQYIKQVDENGNLVDKDLFEINIIVNRKEGEKADRSIAVVEDWKKKNPNYHVNIVDIVFPPDKANVGTARKYITDLTLLRSINRPTNTGPLYIESEDADLSSIDKRTVSKLIKKFDESPCLDVLRGIQDRQPELMQKNDLLFFERRLWDFMEVAMRKQKYRPERMKGSSFVWNRVISGGWNTAYTAESYAQIGGYVSDILGEDMKIGQKISILRGHDNSKSGYVPNTQTAKASGLRASSSPRRFIDAMIKKQDPYHDFDDQSLKDKSINDLMDSIDADAVATPEKIGSYEQAINTLCSFVSEQIVQPEAGEVIKKVLWGIGLRDGDYVMQNPASKNQIKLTDKGMQRIIDLLGKYKADNKYKWGYRRQNSSIV